MLIIPQNKINEFKKIYETHRYYVNTCNIYYHTIRLLRHRRATILTSEDYKEYYKNILADIDLVSPPMDAFIPDTDNHDQNENRDIFVINQLVPEYENIQKRVTIDDLMNTLPNDHSVVELLQNDPTKFSSIVDDIFVHFCIFKYIEKIDQIRLADLSIMAPAIEYVVENISLSDIKSYLESDKINDKKCKKYIDDAFFIPDVKMNVQFYSEKHDDIPTIDVEKLIKHLVSNLVLKSDIYIITAIYLTLSFSKVDIINNQIENSPCAMYVRDVLSKL